MNDLSTSPKFHLYKQFRALNGARMPGFSEPAACVTLAIDELSYVRSTLGYAVSEQVLDLCAERLISETREGDVVIGLGGDTFAVITRGVSEPTILDTVAERLIERLQRSYLIDGHLVDVKVQAGIAMTSSHCNDFDGLLSKSSLALRAARIDGSGICRFFEPGMEHGLLSEQTLIRDLRKALPLRQFSLHFQPQVNTKSCKVTGVEALLRWHHPVRGPIPPSVFIPLAESTGVIHALGAWTIRAACRQAATLPADITIAVNVSPLQLRNPAFIDEVTEALCAANLAGPRLEIEITEGVLLDTSNTTLATVKALTDLGIKFAIDDFGTGYSSLSQIGRLPFHSIKIDRSLVGHDPKRRAVIRAVVALSSGLGLQVLAEGVETEQELAALQQDGCSLFQGYFFGRPVEASRIMGLLTEIDSAQETAQEHIPPDTFQRSMRRCFQQTRRVRRSSTRT